MSSVAPRLVLVTRATELEALVARHGTREQARFFLATRGQAMEEIEERHRVIEEAWRAVQAAIPLRWRRVRLDRSDLSRFVFEERDVVVAVGQDGLVANVAKYLSGQLVIGVNPDPARYDGVLARHAPKAAAALLPAAAEGAVRVAERCMVETRVDDGQRLLALNEVFLGHRTHQSARYRLRLRDREERQSSSGVIVSTGTGATGWARSIHRERHSGIALPRPEEPRLAVFVREAWPSVATGVELTDGELRAGETLELVSEMNEGGVLFGDGIEEDRIELRFGMRATVCIAPERLRLVEAAG